LNGAGLFYEIISMGQIHMYCTLPTFQNIKLGWTVSGEMSSRPSHNSLQAAIIKNPTDHSDDDTLAAIVKQFWETGDFGSEKPFLLPKDLRYEQLFKENYYEME